MKLSLMQSLHILIVAEYEKTFKKNNCKRKQDKGIN